MNEVDLGAAWRVISQGWQWLLDIEWLELLKALAAPIIAFAALRVSRQQVEINASKLRLDLYDRRSEVYTAVKILLGEFFANATIKQEQLDRFRQETAQVDFLFNETISLYLAQINRKGQRLVACTRAHRRGEEREGARKTPLQEMEELESWFSEQGPRAKQLFTPFLRLEPPSPPTLKQRMTRKLRRLTRKSRP